MKITLGNQPVPSPVRDLARVRNRVRATRASCFGKHSSLRPPVQKEEIFHMSLENQKLGKVFFFNDLGPLLLTSQPCGLSSYVGFSIKELRLGGDSDRRKKITAGLSAGLFPFKL